MKERGKGSKVVAIVGAGHVPGIQQTWDKALSVNIDDITSIPEPTFQQRVVSSSLKIAGVVLAGYVGYKFVHWVMDK